MRISDWSSDVCSSDLAFAQDVVLAFLFHAFGDDGDAKRVGHGDDRGGEGQVVRVAQDVGDEAAVDLDAVDRHAAQVAQAGEAGAEVVQPHLDPGAAQAPEQGAGADLVADHRGLGRSEEHTSELQSLMRISYAVFCLKKK